MKIKGSFLVVFIFILTPSIIAQSSLVIDRMDSLRSEMQLLAMQDNLGYVASFYADNATVNGFDVQLKGIDEIRNYWQNINGRGVDWKWENLDYYINDEVIYQTGISHLTLNYGERDITFSTTFILIMEEQTDGSLKIISDYYRPAKNKLRKRYEINRDSVLIQTDTDTLFGIIFKPVTETEIKSPAVLLLQGGGDVGLDNYFYEARFFAENGFVALICDKSGTGLSSGSSSWVTQTFKEKIAEYNHLLSWLRNQSFVDADKTGVHGMSEGGRLALALASIHPDNIAFVNAVSAPIESFKDNQLYAIYHLLHERNFSYPVIIETLSIWNQYFHEVSERNITPEVISRANQLREQEPNLYLPNNTTDLPQRPRPEDIYYSVDSALTKITSPVLMQYGLDDERVNVSKSISLIPEDSVFLIKEYVNTDHSMNTTENSTHRDYLNDKLNWLESILDEK